MKTIPLTSAERIIKKAGAKRVSDDAKKELIKYLEEVGVKISKIAQKLAIHAKRKTIKEEDIKLASKELL